jgi:hypothetical protein
MEQEQRFSMSLLSEILSTLGIREELFGQTHGIMMQNPNTQEFVMAAQQGKLKKPEMGKKVTLTKADTLKHLKTTEKVQEEQMKNMA